MIPQTENPAAPQRHSRLGIASVVIGASLPLLLIFLIVAGGILEANKIALGNYLLIGFAVIGMAGPLIHLIGFGLGLGGLISKKTKKVFPVTGAILNALLGISGILIIYLVISNLKFGFH